jgi:UDP-glucose 4-epimerase
LGTGQGISGAAAFAAIKRVTGSEVPHVMTNARPGDPPALYADPAKSRHILSWQAQRQFEEIVSSDWSWERQLQHLDLQK